MDVNAPITKEKVVYKLSHESTHPNIKTDIKRIKPAQTLYYECIN